jgi:hypothetical protein
MGCSYFTGLMGLHNELHKEEERERENERRREST